MANMLTKMARELLTIEEDLPFRLDYDRDRKVSIDDFELYTFDQVWGSTALGFGGIGGQAMTSARTYVLVPVSCKQDCYVYFAGRFAYKAPYCNRLVEDLKSHNMASVMMSGRYKED